MEKVIQHFLWQGTNCFQPLPNFYRPLYNYAFNCCMDKLIKTPIKLENHSRSKFYPKKNNFLIRKTTIGSITVETFA